MSATPSAEATFSPEQVLHALMVSFIYPLLQNQHTGRLDPMMARNAAIELLKTFRVRDTWELFICIQIMGFGLSAMDSLGLSMAQGLSPAMVLRCRGNANGLQRTSDRSRSALDTYRAATEARRAREAALAEVPDLAEAQAQAAAQIAETERLLALARARAHGTAHQPPPAATTAHAAPTNARPAPNPTRPPAASHPAPVGAPAAARSSTGSHSYKAAILASTAAHLAAPPQMAGALPPIPPYFPSM